MSDEMIAYLKSIDQGIASLRRLLTEGIGIMRDAESEVPEKVRRFMMFYHDVHDLRDMYHHVGVEPPGYVLREIERCDDRLRHILEDAHTDGGVFEKVRRDMANRGGNRYDHTRLLASIKDHLNEAGLGQPQSSGAQGELPLEGSQPGSGVAHGGTSGAEIPAEDV